MKADVVPDRKTWYRARPGALHGWRAVPRELALVAAGVFFYFGVRGLTAGNPEVAVRHAHTLVAWETRLGIYREPAMQDHVDNFHGLITLLNWIYIWGHWPVISLVLLWLVLKHPEGYRVTRNAMLASGAAGLVVFALYPVAPPRLADLGLLDTVTEYSTSYRVLQPAAFVNQYAALPSLHVGWDLLIGIALYTHSTHAALRVMGLTLPLFMAIAVLGTANHYILDVVAGVVLVLICLAGVLLVERRRVRQLTPPAADPAGSACIPSSRSPSALPATQR